MLENHKWKRVNTFNAEQWVSATLLLVILKIRPWPSRLISKGSLMLGSVSFLIYSQTDDYCFISLLTRTCLEFFSRLTSDKQYCSMPPSSNSGQMTQTNDLRPFTFRFTYQDNYCVSSLQIAVPCRPCILPS